MFVQGGKSCHKGGEGDFGNLGETTLGNPAAFDTFCRWAEVTSTPVELAASGPVLHGWPLVWSALEVMDER